MSRDFELVSRYRAGELTPEEMRALEAAPDFAQRLEQLALLDATAQQLSVALGAEKVEALMAKVKRPRAQPPRRLVAAGLLGLAAGVGLVFFATRPPRPEPWQLRAAGEVTVDGRPAGARFPQGSTLRTGPSGNAQLLGVDGWLGLSGGSTLSQPDARGLLLTQGNATVSSPGLRLRARDTTLEVHGLAVISMEPPEGVARVTQTLSQGTPGDLMKTQWMTLSTVALTAAAVGGGLTLFVVDGHASARTDGAAPVEVQAGQQWKEGTRAPTPIRAPAAVAEVEAPEPKALTGKPAGVGGPELPKLSKQELIAMVGKLSGERDSLLQQRDALTRKLDGREQPKGNYYRQSREELNDLAKQGELRLRGPQLSGQETKIDDKVRDGLRLSAAEVAGAKAIFERSTERAHQELLSLYKELGGDPSLAATLGSDALFNELRTKSLKGDWEEAVRRSANERAGLLPAEPGGTPVMKALRMLVAEDERVLDELDALLGPARAEQFLNHENTSHHRHGFGVGPGQPP